MKLLITGSSGLVGSEVFSFFQRRGWEIIGIDSNMRSKFFGTPPQDNSLNLDIRDREKIDELFRSNNFDAIIHAAAQPSHDYATDHVIEDFEVNALGTLYLLEATRKYCPDATFIYVSTDKVYGENMIGSTPFREDLGLDFAGIRSFFGCSKAAADMYVQEYGNRFHMKTVCFRPGCITGRNHQGAEQHGFLAYLTKCIKEGKTYKIFGDGNTVRDQIHAYDLASAFWEVIQNPHIAAVYNIGGGPERAVSVLQAGEMISKELNKPFLHEFHEKRLGDRDWDVHDVSEFRRDYPEWYYKYSLQDIIKDVCSA